MSFWLRHDPQDAGLIADEFGWVDVTETLAALKKRGREISLQELIELNNSFDKVRWQFSDDQTKIRATHGHSIPVVLEGATTPPPVLYHGTASRHLDAIKRQGLIPKQRQFVHLSANTEVALEVGKRHGKPVLIEIDAEKLAGDGWQFYQTSDNVWLTAAIPVSYLTFE